MRILILGAGATGGYFGGRLAESGADVAFLLRPARAAKIAAEGLRIISREGDVTARVTVLTAETLKDPFDLVVVGCKAYDLDQAIAAIAPAIGPKTMILPLLNGLLHLEKLVAAFGDGPVLGGLCAIEATLDADGAVRHLSGLHSLTFGERAGGTSARVEAVAAILAKANFVSRASDKVMQDMWEKFGFLTTLAGMTCLMRASIGHILQTRDGAAMIAAFYAECQAVAAASGHALRPKVVEGALAFLTKPGSPSTASMMRDLESGARVEADHIVGDMLARAEAHGLPAPLLRVAYCHLQSYMARRGAA